MFTFKIACECGWQTAEQYFGPYRSEGGAEMISLPVYVPGNGVLEAHRFEDRADRNVDQWLANEGAQWVSEHCGPDAVAVALDPATLERTFACPQCGHDRARVVTTGIV